MSSGGNGEAFKAIEDLSAKIEARRPQHKPEVAR
jgi:hypothetical protein